jgi:hypothetical protein
VECIFEKQPELGGEETSPQPGQAIQKNQRVEKPA